MAPSKKRKADEEFGDEMSVSPMSSPAISSRQLSRPSKKARASDITGRSLPLPRLLEALNASQLRTILQTICDHHPEIALQVTNHAPRPTAASTLDLLGEYQQRVRNAMPYGHSSADYNYYRVKQPLVALVDAIADFTRQFLPPVETHSAASLQFLDGATKIIHQLPDWDSVAHRQHKEGAYDEISRAWALVIQEASKRGGGLALLSEHWDQIIAKHNHQSGGRLGAAVNALSTNVGWAGAANNSSAGSSASTNDPNSIRNQLMNGTFGSPVRVGPW
ncbi:nuclear envelope protein cut8 [Grosmannia clavigera kw1407]|uniref:Tethering factor for nuclear proteasome STS1 n=1 Tax=Grosmannia clavigera (strain kw1407 / UAMH 11150) TaxID=655863 RepID=F0XFN6_GROCL|nr:nuclear envelope protein cut8 [Grosmannia clavigera kw1407]EFX04323.1 nuclear envelope protein cut8 [Grosmannia clavigera kw1407]